MQCPRFASTFIVADNARLAAQASSRFVTPGRYLPVIDGPRIMRPDADAEVIRRSNAIARVGSERLVLAGLSSESEGLLRRNLEGRFAGEWFLVTSPSDLPTASSEGAPPLKWGRDRIGIGLLKALRERRSICFLDQPSPTGPIASKWGHLVVCEEGEELSEVIAANYAYALRAGLATIPRVPVETAERLQDAFYNLNDDSSTARGLLLKELQAELRRLCGELPLTDVESITFITGELPFGFAFAEVPTTHLFRYPDLGVAIVNGFAAEQHGGHQTGIAAVVDPGAVAAPEIEAAVTRLARRGAYVRTYSAEGATVRAVTEAVEWLPYDLLLIATHCSDASGSRWTYEYTDSEGYDRRLVVDVALGVARTDDPDRFHVTTYTYYVSLDGIDWHDPLKHEKLHVGRAITDFIEKTRGTPALEPVLREPAKRVRWSAALRMHDGNFLAVHHSLAETGTPIILNNACGSLHRLGGTFMFAGARAYIGTLFPVMGVEAQEVTDRVLGKYFGRPLANALWHAQCETHEESYRRPYILFGAHPQRLHSVKHDVPKRLARRLANALRAWQTRLPRFPEGTYAHGSVEATIAFYSRELEAVLRLWPAAAPKQ